MSNERVALVAARGLSAEVMLPIEDQFEDDGVLYRLTTWELLEHEREPGEGRYRLTVTTIGESPRGFTIRAWSFDDAESAIGEHQAILRRRAAAEEWPYQREG